MNNVHSQEDHILQLKQMIIFLKSEVAKYENEIRELKQNDYYSHALKLEEENFEIKKEAKQLSLELLKLKRGFDQEIQSMQNEILTYKKKNEKLILSIQNLVEEKNNLKAEKIRLDKMLKQNVQLSPNPPNIQPSPPFPNIEQTISGFFDKTHQQLQNLQEEINWNQLRLHQHVLEQIENEGNQIKQLLNTMEETRVSTAPPSNKAFMNSTLLSQLDQQIKLIYSKTRSFEKQLEEKIQLLDNIEQQLIELTNDIEKQ